MNTRKLDAKVASDVTLAMSVLLNGGVVAVPTETVYGLAADASNETAVASIFSAKERPIDHPLIVHIGSASELTNWAVDIPAEAKLLAAAFWPGPLTLLLKKASHVSPAVTGGLATIGLRVPAHPAMQSLLQGTGLGLAAPSANPYKQLSPTSAAQVIDKLDGKIDAVLDGGDCAIGLESTIVDLSADEIRVLRVGPIMPSELSKIINKPVLAPLNHSVSVSGNVADHYQPRTPLKLVSRTDMALKIASESCDAALVVLADFPLANKEGRSDLVVMPESKGEFSKALYRTLHELDQKGLAAIWFEAPPQSEEWLDVNDRLLKACHSA